MKKIIAMVLISLTMLGTLSATAFGATAPQDVRAVWISTVYNIDFPSVKAKNNAEAQKEEFIEKLGKLQAIGMNTVVVQVRPKGDALYASNINPWSDVLTDEQGKDPGYDPMAFMIEEAHKRGMAFHAWLNPYRVTTSGTDLTKLSENHPARLHPEWVISQNNALYYNPELPEVKQHIVDTVKEIVTNYNVDGVHFDDYFYPANYPLPVGEGKDGYVASSRREHVNDMIAQVSQSVRKTNKKVVFGISPGGIWKNSKSDFTGSNTGGSESYYSVYADTRTWIQNEWVDYIVPQIYWETGHKLADYETLINWWADEVEGTKVKLYIGQGIYKDVVAGQMDTQLALNQGHNNIKGSFYFSLRDLLNNRMGCKDKISSFYAGMPTQFIWTEQSTNTLGNTTQGTNTQGNNTSASAQAVGKTASVTASILNIRGGARVDRPVVTKVKKGQKVTIVGTLGSWYKVKLPTGVTGWASAEFIKL